MEKYAHMENDASVGHEVFPFDFVITLSNRVSFRKRKFQSSSFLLAIAKVQHFLYYDERILLQKLECYFSFAFTKCPIIGGKTSLIHAYMPGPEASSGVPSYTKDVHIEGHTIELTISDTTGQGNNTK